MIDDKDIKKPDIEYEVYLGDIYYHAAPELGCRHEVWTDLPKEDKTMHPGKRYRRKYKPKFKENDLVRLKGTSNPGVLITSVGMTCYSLKGTTAIIPYEYQDDYEVIKKYDYPIYKSIYRGWDKEVVFKYTDLTIREVVFTGVDSVSCVGDEEYDCELHTESRLQDVLYSRDRNLYDGQPVLCWDGPIKNKSIIAFYDALNDGAFDGNGGITTYNNMVPYPHPEDDFIIEMYSTLNIGER